MNIVYKQAFSEVLEVLRYTEESIIKKIPSQFIIFLDNNKDDEYIVNIDFSKTNWEDDIKLETQAILGLIYRDYVVSPEKKSKLIKEEREEQIRIENEIREKYNPDNIFKNKKEASLRENTILPVEIKKESFFKKLICFIKELFNKKWYKTNFTK